MLLHHNNIGSSAPHTHKEESKELTCHTMITPATTCVHHGDYAQPEESRSRKPTIVGAPALEKNEERTAYSGL